MTNGRDHPFRNALPHAGVMNLVVHEHRPLHDIKESSTSKIGGIT